MGLVRWNPVFNDRFFNEFFNNTPTARKSHANRWSPAVNIKETEDNYQLELAVPGFQKDDFKIEVNEGILSVSTEHKTVSDEETKDKYTRREFRFSAFKRRFTLPETANDADISATYQDGILNLVVPKKEEAKPQPARLIEIG